MKKILVNKFRSGSVGILIAVVAIIILIILFTVFTFAFVGDRTGVGSNKMIGYNDGSNANGLCDAVPQKYQQIFTAAGKKFNVQPAFIAAIFSAGEHANSWPNPNGPWASSPVGASGPFQFMPGTWDSYKQDGNGDGVMDIQNLKDASFAAAHYLADLGAGNNTTNEDKLTEAAAQYNGGTTPPSYSYRVYAKNVITAFRSFLCQNAPTSVIAEGHTFPLARYNWFGGWLNDRCSGTGSGRNHAHGGADIMHTRDDKVPVYAVVDGIIYRRQRDGSSLSLQSINPNDPYLYFYQHMSSSVVSNNQKASVGTLIGYSGGYSAGAQGDHLHFSMMTCSNSPVEIYFGPGQNCANTSKTQREQLAAQSTCLIDPTPSLKEWVKNIRSLK